MSGSLGRPDWGATIADLARRVGILERRTTPATPAVADEIIFSFAGSLAVSTSPPTRSRRGGTLGVLAVTFASGTAGSTDTVLLVLRNGTTVATVTVPASTEVYNANVAVAYAADTDTLALAVDTAGTGAADMTAAARFT